MSRLDIAWIRGRFAGHRPEVISAELAPRRAAVASIFRASDGQSSPELLFIRRAQHEQDPWSGHMAFPGGRVEQRDLSPLDAARRETWEEVRIDLARTGELVGQMDDIMASARGRMIGMAITPYVFVLSDPVLPRRNRSEVEEVLWVPVGTLLDPASASTVPYELAGQRYELPCFQIQGRTIWGLTYQMLRQMFVVLEWESGR